MRVLNKSELKNSKSRGYKEFLVSKAEYFKRFPFEQEHEDREEALKYLRRNKFRKQGSSYIKGNTRAYTYRVTTGGGRRIGWIVYE